MKYNGAKMSRGHFGTVSDIYGGAKVSFGVGPNSEMS